MREGDEARSAAGMEVLWAPWRMPYVGGGKAENGCLFCETPQAGDDRKHFILHRGLRCFVMMNIYPYSNGHVMIAPYRHLDRLERLATDEVTEMATLAQRSTAILGEAVGAEGFNLGMNLGRVAGAGVVGHLHLHVVPRWGGDTNFMPVIGGVKVMPEALEATYEKLRSRYRAKD